MKITFLVDTDFTNYRRAAMFIGIPYCDGKCNVDAGEVVCQNDGLDEYTEISPDLIVKSYLNNDIVHALVIGGREPFYVCFPEVLELIRKLRQHTDDDVIIYTGYNKDECEDKIEQLKQFPNIIVKYGRYVPYQESILDPVLGIKLASPNQFAEKIS